MIGIIGLGFMGRTHAAAYEAARDQGYPVAISGYFSLASDPTSAPQIGNLETAAPDQHYHRYPDLDALFADPAVRAVSICTPTDTHCDLALRALEAGKHVLVEKPVALEEKSIAALGDLAARAGRWVVPAFCMRHWPGWAWLHQRIRAGTFGPALGGSFLRTGARPDWSEVYADDRRSGGALFDIHIHDVDFIRWCWGTPRTVSSTGSIRHLATHYRMTEGPGLLVAEGGWLSQPGTPFRMRYTVEFADAVVDFDLGRDPTVLLTRGTITEPVRFLPGSAYDLQARHFLDLILDRTDQPVATLDDALLVTAILRAERASIDQGKPVPVAVAGRRVEP